MVTVWRKKLRLAETAEKNTKEGEMRILVLNGSFSERQRKL